MKFLTLKCERCEEIVTIEDSWTHKCNQLGGHIRPLRPEEKRKALTP